MCFRAIFSLLLDNTLVNIASLHPYWSCFFISSRFRLKMLSIIILPVFLPNMLSFRYGKHLFLLWCLLQFDYINFFFVNNHCVQQTPEEGQKVYLWKVEWVGAGGWKFGFAKILNSSKRKRRNQIQCKSKIFIFIKQLNHDNILYTNQNPTFQMSV